MTTVTVYDNLSKGHRESDTPVATLVHAELLDSETLTTTLLQRDIESVIHMAADSLVGESVTQPGKDYQNNVVAGAGYARWDEKNRREAASLFINRRGVWFSEALIPSSAVFFRCL